MRKNTVTQDFKQEFVLARFYEVEALIYLVRNYAETQYSDSDLMLINSLKLLSEGVLMDLYKAITLETEQEKAGVNNG